MKKGTFISDTFERAKDELIRPTAKGMVNALKDTLSPTAILEKTLGTESINNSKQEQIKDFEKKGSTPLDFDKLQKSYKSQDKVQADALANKFFQKLKSEEENQYEKTKQQKEQSEKNEINQKQQKDQQLREQQHRSQQQTEPQGKQKRGLFSPRRVAKREQMEVKPASGKQ